MAASNSALLYVITGPVGPYYPTGFKPVTLLADPKHVRAAEGGSGAFKMGVDDDELERLYGRGKARLGCVDPANEISDNEEDEDEEEEEESKGKRGKF